MFDEVFALRQKYKDVKVGVMQFLIKTLMNSLYGEQIRKEIEDNFVFKSDYWMLTEYDEQVKKFWKISHGNYIIKMVDDKGLGDEVKKLNTIPLHVGAFVSWNSQRLLNKFNGFYTNVLYYTNTESLYSENEHWDKIDKLD